MDVQDGFIAGIFNYCDGWCERCALTSRCRVFAHLAEFEASSDPALEPVVHAPPLPAERPPEAPPWMREIFDEADRAATEPGPGSLEPPLPPEHERISRRASDYCGRVYGWLRSRGFASIDSPADPRAVLAWFHTLIPVKIERALKGLALDDPEERDGAPDHDGSARIALLGIEESHVACRQLLERGLAQPADVQPLLADLVWLGTELERAFPGARAFVRPGFDEPDEVARLLAAEGRR